MVAKEKVNEQIRMVVIEKETQITTRQTPKGQERELALNFLPTHTIKEKWTSNLSLLNGNISVLGFSIFYWIFKFMLMMNESTSISFHKNDNINGDKQLISEQAFCQAPNMQIKYSTMCSGKEVKEIWVNQLQEGNSCADITEAPNTHFVFLLEVYDGRKKTRESGGREF